MVYDNNPKLKCIERALHAYHYALDRDEDANTAARRAIDAIQEIVGKPWVPGAVLEQRRRRFTWQPGDLVIMKRKDGEGS